MSQKPEAAPLVASLPMQSEFCESLIQIAIVFNLPIVALRDPEDGEPPAILFVNEKLLPGCLDALLPALSRITRGC